MIVITCPTAASVMFEAVKILSWNVSSLIHSNAELLESAYGIKLESGLLNARVLAYSCELVPPFNFVNSP